MTNDWLMEHMSKATHFRTDKEAWHIIEIAKQDTKDIIEIRNARI